MYGCVCVCVYVCASARVRSCVRAQTSHTTNPDPTLTDVDNTLAIVCVCEICDQITCDLCRRNGRSPCCAAEQRVMDEKSPSSKCPISPQNPEEFQSLSMGDNDEKDNALMEQSSTDF